MKNQKRLFAILLTVVIVQSAFIFSSFKTVEKENLQSYRIEKKYTNGKYFYVLISNGEAKAFIEE